MSELVIKQAIEIVEDQGMYEAISAINDSVDDESIAEEIKEEVVQTAIDEGLVAKESLGDVIRNRAHKIKRTGDPDIDRLVIQLHYQRTYRIKRSHL